MNRSSPKLGQVAVIMYDKYLNSHIPGV